VSTPEPTSAAAPPAEPVGRAIEAIGLSRRYDDFLAIDDASFTVEEGEIFGLLGPNGAGKTTLLRMLAGVLRPDRGQALILGHDAATEPLWVKARLGFLSGDTALYGRLSVAETLDYFGRLASMEDARLEARTREVIQEFGLADFLEERVQNLSSGQRQRANLARAFLPDPPVLILDEPTVTLDVISGHFVIAAVKRAKAAGRGVLFSTHIMSEADELCDRIGLLVRGKIADIGTREELLDRHASRSLSELIVKLHEAGP
jgi:sodium transport system ATP-binding protein